MSRRVEHACVGAVSLLAGLLAAPSAAQNADPPRAPRIIGTPAPPATQQASPAPEAAARAPVTLPLRITSPRPPSAARLAPLPEERGEIEEILIVGKGWRLPDLGSEWRLRQAAAARGDRFTATALPLYDPNRPPQRADSFFASREQQRHGYIEIFRLRFGRRSRD
jgi:hypothetical protein